MKCTCVIPVVKLGETACLTCGGKVKPITSKRPVRGRSYTTGPDGQPRDTYTGEPMEL